MTPGASATTAATSAATIHAMPRIAGVESKALAIIARPEQEMTGRSGASGVRWSRPAAIASSEARNA